MSDIMDARQFLRRATTMLDPASGHAMTGGALYDMLGEATLVVERLLARINELRLLARINELYYELDEAESKNKRTHVDMRKAIQSFHEQTLAYEVNTDGLKIENAEMLCSLSLYELRVCELENALRQLRDWGVGKRQRKLIEEVLDEP